MTIQYAILGLLNRQPLSGYDLKKIIADSTVLYWSGNNNQIYRTLVQLHEEGLVTYEVISQQDVPAKKVYSISSPGRDMLRSWLLSPPEPPELHSNFLIRLAWADLLSPEEFNQLLDQYEEEIRMQAIMEKEKARRSAQMPIENKQAQKFADLIFQNLTSFYEHELSWITKIRQTLVAG